MTAYDAPVGIIGGGVAGLTAAQFLAQHKVPFVLFETGKELAGLARSYSDGDGFSYDFGAHFITNRLAGAIGIGSQCRTVEYYGESVIQDGALRSYPLGLMRSPRYVLSGAAAQVRGMLGMHAAAQHAADEFRQQYGRALADEVALPLLERWSGAPGEALAPSVAGKFGNGILKTIYLRMAARWLGVAVSCGYSNEMPEAATVWHVYPEGGVSAICARLAAGLEQHIRFESRVERILVDSSAAQPRVVGARINGVDQTFSAVINTAPVAALARMAPDVVGLKPLLKFRYRPMVFVNMRFGRRGILPNTTLWTPQSQPFFRLTETPLSMPWHAPAGKTLITADIGCEVGDAHWSMADEELGRICVGALERLYPGVTRDYLGCRVLRTPIAYPVYLKEYEQERQDFARSTGVQGLWSIGRNGSFSHLLMEDIYWRTRRQMRELLAYRQQGDSPRHSSDSGSSSLTGRASMV